MLSDKYKQAYTVLQKLVQNKVLDPETWTQDDDTALNKFYRGETVIMSTNRAQYAVQDAKVKEQLGEGNYELYRILTPIGTSDYQAENQRLECGIMISSNALNELGEDEFIKMMRKTSTTRKSIALKIFPSKRTVISAGMWKHC